MAGRAAARDPAVMRRDDRSPYFESFLLIGSGLLVALLIVLL
jgi:hypothetical protein